MISHRVLSIQQPPLVELGQLATNQSNCISLGQGAPYYSPSPSFFDEFAQNISPQTHRYTADPGLLEVRTAIVNKLQEDQKVSVSPSQVVVTPGANQAFYNCLLTISDPGDEIILFSPYYFNHHMACVSMNLTPILVPHSTSFTIDPVALQEAITPKTKAIVLVNPGNPTGIVYNRQTLQQVIEIAQHHGILLLADETYEYFTYGDRKHVPLGSLTDDNLIMISSFSKTFGIPGWRLGYYVGSQDMIDQSIKVQDTIGICAPHISQQLGLRLLEQRSQFIPNFVHLMESNHNLAKDLIEEISWLDDTQSHGAYYLFPRQNTGIKTMKLVKQLIMNNGVYIVPGIGFGSSWDTYCRLSFANVEEEELKEAFTRLRAYS